MLVELLILLLVAGLVYVLIQRGPFDAGFKQVVIWILLVVCVIYVVNLFTGIAWRPLYR